MAFKNKKYGLGLIFLSGVLMLCYQNFVFVPKPALEPTEFKITFTSKDLKDKKIVLSSQSPTAVINLPDSTEFSILLESFVHSPALSKDIVCQIKSPDQKVMDCKKMLSVKKVFNSSEILSGVWTFILDDGSSQLIRKITVMTSAHDEIAQDALEGEDQD